MTATTTVVINLPASEPVTLFKPEGDPGGIDQLATIVLEAAGRYDEYSDESAQFHRTQGWLGDSGEKYVKRAKRVALKAGRMRNTLKRTGRAVLACADRLRGHQRTYEEHVDRKRHLDRRLEALTAEIAAATNITIDQGKALQERADDLAVKYKSLVEDDRALARVARSNERLLAETLESANERDEVTDSSGGRPETALRAMQKPGSPMSGEATPEQVRAWWKELSNEERRAVIASYSHKIASTEGIPAEARERADRVRDEEVIIRLKEKAADGTITGEEADRLTKLQREADLEARERQGDKGDKDRD
ncbi:hypothetical protein [Nocardioides solisilvae]|uniref:hypothetical protein n=1 Tax=Nocardioides solisilvae TaxID=1542435 RepID=UPI000D7439D8|nr:hypothetical protein [Nocardioides solisilvae]